MDTLQTALRNLGADPAAQALSWETLITQASGRASTSLSALPDICDITLYRGMDFTLLLDVYGPDGEPLDITARDVLAEIRVTADSEGEPAGSWSPAASANTIALSLPSAVTSQLPPSSRYDVWLCDYPRTPLVAGTLTVVPRVTRCPA